MMRVRLPTNVFSKALSALGACVALPASLLSYLFHRRYDSGKVVIYQNHVRALLG